MKVLTAMSGGVDSSVAAARMVDAGHEVTGVHLALSKSASVPGSRGCCTLDDARDARRVSDRLDIPFYVWDLSEQFAIDVMENFLDEYQHGNTPNPCLRCNERIKFLALLDRALALDFDAVATGHYALVTDGPHGKELHRAVDPEKDQSYVLGVLESWQLEHSLFPLGGDFKEQIRAEAEGRGLLTARKPDSHDICFIPDGDTGAFLRRKLGDQPGEIIDLTSGEVVAEHEGAFGFTIGQRRGLDLRVPAADGKPRYVVDIDIQTRKVFVGPPTLLDIDQISAVRPTWTNESLGGTPTACTAQVRAHGEPVDAIAQLVEDVLVVDLHQTIRGLATGQAVVLYDGTRVIGSATVERTRRVVIS
ncbi:MAG: tRNA 2-thiouridine(34) synthase MnmA [Actinomycetota bacterium]|nr:tRNA 2-thiouridine(34) synthase MnmA [Actinomycetota bacterium]